MSNQNQIGMCVALSKLAHCYGTVLARLQFNACGNGVTVLARLQYVMTV